MPQLNQDLKDLIDLNKDGELAIFKAIKAVDKSVDNLSQEVKEIVTEAFADIPEQVPTDLTDLNSKIDKITEKVNEPVVVKVKFV